MILTYTIPIILDENSSPTEKELMEGESIYKKRSEIVFDNIWT